MTIRTSHRLPPLFKLAWRPLVGTALGAAALYLAFRDVEIGQMRETLAAAFDVSHRLDRAIENGLNAPGAFSGEIVKRENIPSAGSPPRVLAVAGQAARPPTTWWRCGTRRTPTIRWHSCIEPGNP